MIKNIVFDFGRVIVDFDETKMTRVFVKDESLVARVRDEVFSRVLWDPSDLGLISDEDLKDGFCKRLPPELHEAARAVYDRWLENLDVVPHIEDAVRVARERFSGLYLLSNISCKFAEEWREHPAVARILSLFDGLVFSGPLHMVKPDERIFCHLLDTYALTPDECLFIDDSEKNLKGARALGIHTYLFDGDAVKLTEYLKTI